MTTFVAKADGTQEKFNVLKLKQSLIRSGATSQEVKAIVAQIESIIYDGIKTQEIYRHAFELLRESETAVAARYSLRRALFNLGPTGFPFEDYLARLFTHEGYTTKTRIEMKGNCAVHEIDVAAYKADHSFIAEAKFHSNPGMKSDLQVALYSFARLHDLRNAKICRDDVCGVREFLIVTNTKFTTAAEKYAICSGLKLLSWEYPKENNLHDRIQKSGLYPVTVLQTLTQAQKRTLIDAGAIICSDILKNQELLESLHLGVKKTNAVLDEVQKISSVRI